MVQIDIYTKATCPYCQRAMQLLTRKGVSYHEIPIDGDETRREEMITRSGRRTVPQIFINNHHIGGCDDLHALEASGELNQRLR